MAAARDEEDPLCLRFVVRKSLEISSPKLAIQCAHAMQLVMLRYLRYYTNPDCNESEEELSRCKNLKEWLVYPYRKALLVADDKEWEKLKTEIPVFLVKDAGINEVDPGTETVLALWPMRKSEAPKLVKRLQACKMPA
jgi:peptidyl-tRNA hydrolase, PTH2 family